MTTGHDAGAFQSSFFAAGNTSADKSKSLCRQLFAASIGINVIRIAAVDDDVAFRQQWLQLFNHGIDRSTGLNHDHDSARRSEAVDKFCQRVIALDAIRRSRFNNSRRTTAKTTHELMSGFSRPVVNADRKTFIGHVHDQVLSHDGKANKADIVF